MSDVAAIAQGLARFEARGPCTDAERRAAAWLHDELRDAGHEAWVETHWVRPQWALSVALHATVGVVASLVAITAPLPGLVAVGVAALSMALEAAGLPGLLRLAFPRRATQNVLTEPDQDRAGRAGARAAAGAGAAHAVTLLIAAPYAAPKGGLGARFIHGRRWWVAGALVLVAACAGLRALGVDGLWLGLLQFVPTIFLLLALAAAGDAAVASSVAGGEGPPAVAVALHDELRRHPPERLAPALLLHGAPRAHLRREKPDRRATVVLELGPGDAPAFATSHPQLRAAAAPLGSVRRALPRRLPTLRIGVPVAGEDALDLAVACVDAIDAQLT